MAVQWYPAEFRAIKLTGTASAENALNPPNLAAVLTAPQVPDRERWLLQRASFVARTPSGAGVDSASWPLLWVDRRERQNFLATASRPESGITGLHIWEPPIPVLLVSGEQLVVSWESGNFAAATIHVRLQALIMRDVAI